MVKIRRPLGSLASEINAGGEDRLRKRVGPEQSPVQRHTQGMYPRREESWRPLTRQRVAAFLRLFVLCFVELENGLPLQTVTYHLLKKKLVKRILPWIHNRLVYTMDERFCPITLEQFRVVDQNLVDHMPMVRRDDDWGAIAYLFKEVVQQRREEYQRLEDMEREVMEAVRRCLGH